MIFLKHSKPTTQSYSLYLNLEFITTFNFACGLLSFQFHLWHPSIWASSWTYPLHSPKLFIISQFRVYYCFQFHLWHHFLWVLSGAYPLIFNEFIIFILVILSGLTWSREFAICFRLLKSTTWSYSLYPSLEFIITFSFTCGIISFQFRLWHLYV